MSKLPSFGFSIGFLRPLFPFSAFQPQRSFDFFPSILWAVPKKKTTHRKKRLRMNGKWLKPQHNAGACPYCGTPVLMHHICRTCLHRALKPTSFSSP
ncbi:hypothetical protein HK098_003510 [Nowakowskiella sp. JEL0407]|nr:hypothetical protein HK098_003510 [Nowakowskiella sp. JEL0407]